MNKEDYIGLQCEYCGRKIRASYLWAVPFCTQKCACFFANSAFKAGYRIKPRFGELEGQSSDEVKK